MKLLLIVDNHLYRTPDGKVWSKGIYDYSFFSRYLDVFELVNVVIRIKDIDEYSSSYPNLCSGDGIKFLSLPDFYGVKGYFRNYTKVKNLIKLYSEDCDCAIVRIPSAIGFQFASILTGVKPIGLEVVVDPWDFAAPKMLKTKLRPIIRVLWTLRLKAICKRANGVSYVTRDALQKRYPSTAHKHGESEKYFTTHYSSANIKEDFFMDPKVYNKRVESVKIIHVANAINSYVKGHLELIKVTKKLKDANINVETSFIGDGELISEFEKFAVKLNVKNEVKFLGRIPDKHSMRSKLREHDLFVFPTHGEGLPRVLIEAMAVGTMCISTKVNGIPELLPQKYLADVGDVNSITERVKDLIENPRKMTEYSEYSVLKAKEYEENVLQIRRKEFYEKLRNYTLKESGNRI